ncbi:MAG TPA: DedA family protein [Frankiaceae bacterium]|nr:DedA family protein [Frankiaceae bacterium]
MHLAVNLLDSKSLISSWGLVGLLAIIFAETGLLIGFFLPGDTLLFLAGAVTVAHSDPHLPLAGVMIGTALASIIGAQVGWLIGAKAGPKIFDRPRSRLFDPHNVARAHSLLDRFHYGLAIVVSRFVPVVRTFINPVCGVAEIPARAFLVWNIIGGILWTQLIVLLGRALGPKVHIDKYILPIVAVIIVISVVGILLEARKGGKRLKAADAEAAAAGRAAAPQATTEDRA